jgi:L-amino acid N-acyltransferase YncA
MTSGRFVRNATPEDAGRLAEIYNQGIEERIATFETEPRSPAEIGAWFENGYPVFVAGAGDRVMAYSVAYPYRPRRCYEGVREFSIYTAREARGSGFGRAALSALIDDAKARGWWKLLSRVFPENIASRALLQSAGFREVGIYEKHAKLDGQWRDVVIVEKFFG